MPDTYGRRMVIVAVKMRVLGRTRATFSVFFVSW